MTLKKLTCYSMLILAIASCSRATIRTMPLAAVPLPTPFLITEDFESGAKSDYAAGPVQLASGSWTLSNAVIGGLAADHKNRTKSIRMKSGELSMNFDIGGVNSLYIKHAKYGDDPESTWKILYSMDGGRTFKQLGHNILETNTVLVTDTFNLAHPGRLRIRIENTGSTRNARINLDDICFAGVGDPSAELEVPDSTMDTLQQVSRKSTNMAGTRGIEVGPDAEPESGDDSNLLFGNPSNASSTTPDNFYMNQRYYVESYNSSRSIPNWVSWHLDSSNTTNASPRQDNFAGYNGLPEGFYVVKSSSYNGSGFDRGHNCPSADRSSSTAANGATFLMTNMIPQAPRNNEQTWAHFEEYLRSQVHAGNEVYIIMGSYGTGGLGSRGAATSIDSGRVAVPAHVWKVALIIPVGNNDLNRISSMSRVIAVNTANDNTIDPDWKKYIVSVRDIEKATGYDLLSALPKTIQDQIEVKKDPGK